VRITWIGKGAAVAALVGDPVDLTREANGDVAVLVDLKVASGPTAPVTLGGRDVTARLRTLAGTGGWGQVAVPLRCYTGTDLARVTQPFAMATAGQLDVTISGIRLGSPTEGLVDCR
jgi:beta-glucosidase